MKPRLRKRHGVWVCRAYQLSGRCLFVMGHGYTPEEAYDDWRAQL